MEAHTVESKVRRVDDNSSDLHTTNKRFGYVCEPQANKGLSLYCPSQRAHVREDKSTRPRPAEQAAARGNKIPVTYNVSMYLEEQVLINNTP